MKKRDYWDSIVQEVQHQGDAEYSFAYTNIGDLSVREKTADYRRERQQQQKMTMKVYTLGINYPQVTFTRREAECLCHLLKGRTQARSAEEMGLSRRTIEFYVRNMKLKARCETQAALIELVIESDFLKGVDF